MKMEPKTKRSYGKRKAISVPELLAVRVEMSSEESAKPKSNPDELLINVLVPATQDKTELIAADNVDYNVDNVQEISVYEDVQEIDWIENPEHSQTKVNNLPPPLNSRLLF